MRSIMNNCNCAGGVYSLPVEWHFSSLYLLGSSQQQLIRSSNDSRFPATKIVLLLSSSSVNINQWVRRGERSKSMDGELNVPQMYILQYFGPQKLFLSRSPRDVKFNGKVCFGLYHFDLGAL